MQELVIVTDKFGRHSWVKVERGLRDCCGYAMYVLQMRKNGKNELAVELYKRYAQKDKRNLKNELR